MMMVMMVVVVKNKLGGGRKMTWQARVAKKDTILEDTE